MSDTYLVKQKVIPQVLEVQNYASYLKNGVIWDERILSIAIYLSQTSN